MEQKTISIYGETYTMNLFLPEYVYKCSRKQLKRVLHMMVTSNWDDHKLESDLIDMLDAVTWSREISHTKTALNTVKAKRHMIVDAINTYTDRMVEYDD